MTEGLDKIYDPGATEKRWYAHWQESGYFKARVNSDKPAYCITIPPPNVTGELHMGHAIQHAIHDMVVRWKRMQGYETLCLPGTDHAGIATQMKVEQELAQSEGKTRYDVGRDGLLERIRAWRDKYGGAIYDQLRQLGASYDWDRARFTLDDDYLEAVLQAFARFYAKGWIYRGTRMINWCPTCGTVISDLETEERVLQGHLWHLRYKGIAGGPDVVVATTRPETMLGDTAVAVHPRDPRWAKAVGQQVLLPLMERAIAIVGDEYADPEMGSGAVKITPAHDPNDYEVGQRHDLPQIQVIGFDGLMRGAAGPYAGQDRQACRQAVLQDLQAQGLLEQVEEHEHAVPHHDRCGTVIEPLPMEQWFMNMRDLADLTRPHLQRQDIQYVPDRFGAYAVDWLDNIRDWALSRQIWWGHRIPAWYCRTCSGKGLEPMGGLEPEEAFAQGSFRVSVEKGAKPVVSPARPGPCPQCGGDHWVQDPDVLDTWFSSALWPFATLGWPQDSRQLDYFYPTDLMITARDILYLWVLRMVMTSLECRQQIPFKTVLVHPTVLTRDGRRMSKSLGTGLNPLDLIELYGADATRYSLLHQVGASQDVRFDADIADNQVKSSANAEEGRNFCNKLWNAARFVLMNLEGYSPDRPLEIGPDLADRWIVSRLAATVAAVEGHLHAYRFSDATRALYDFIWRDYCDWYLEMAKGRLNGDDPGARARVQHTLVAVLEQALRLLHPAMPFITEALWQALPLGPDRAPSIMVAAWPRPGQLDEEAEEALQTLREVVTVVRNMRAEMRLPPGQPIALHLGEQEPENRVLLGLVEPYIAQLVRADQMAIEAQVQVAGPASRAVVGTIEVAMPLAGLIDIDVERQRLQKDVSKFQGLLKGLDKKLANEGFLHKAPAQVVEGERARREEYRTTLATLEAGLQALA